MKPITKLGILVPCTECQNTRDTQGNYYSDVKEKNTFRSIYFQADDIASFVEQFC